MLYKKGHLFFSIELVLEMKQSNCGIFAVSTEVFWREKAFLEANFIQIHQSKQYN